MFHNTRTLITRASVVAGAFVVLAPQAAAVEYVFEPAVAARAYYDDNVRLSQEGNEVESGGLDIEPQFKLTASSEQWQVALNTKLKFVRFEEDVFNSDDQLIGLRLTRSTPLTVLQVDFQNNRSNTITDDFENLEELDFESSRRDRQTLRPVFQWVLNPKHRIVFGATVENMHYDTLIYDDYDYNGLDLGWTFQFDEKTQFQVTANATQFESVAADPLRATDPACFSFVPSQEFGDFESDSVGLTLGVTRQSSERLSYRASVGQRETETGAMITTCGLVFQFPQIIPVFIQDEQTADSSSLVVDLGVNYAGEKYTFDATLSRSLVPIGLGFLTQRDDLRVNFNYQFAEHFYGRLYLAAFDSSGVDDTNSFEREGLNIQPSVQWRFAERWNLTAGVRFRTYESISTRGKRDGTQVFVGLKYDFKPTLISR